VEVAAALVQAGGRQLVLLTDKDGCSCLYTACRNGQLRVVTEAIIPGVDPELGRELAILTNAKGFSCLTAACFRGDLAVAEALLNSFGMDTARKLLMLTSSLGSSCLSFAASYGHLQVCARLVYVCDRCMPNEIHMRVCVCVCVCVSELRGVLWLCAAGEIPGGPSRCFAGQRLQGPPDAHEQAGCSHVARPATHAH